MKQIVFLFGVFLIACNTPEKQEGEAIKKQDSTFLQTTETNTATSANDPDADLPPVKTIKKPNGIYQALLPVPGRIEQTVAFNKDLTYQLQEKYIDKDSIAVMEGTWIPSDGFIWLYKDQVVRARYKWDGDQLQYYSPLLKKSVAMKQLQDVNQNSAWQNKAGKGVIIYGAGNEPFWNIEYDNKDSVSFLVSEWNQPLKLKVDSSSNTKDSIAITAHNDSVKLQLSVFPFFCSDGMSEFTYRNKIKVRYNQQVFTGCGTIYR